jgi:hypothetical protein
MASDIHFTPIAPVRWCHLITARTQLDESKPRAWTAELVLSPATEPKHKAFIDKLDQIFTDTHGTKKKRSDKGQPWKADREDPSKVVVKFKALEFVREDGSKASGPQLIDSKRQPWDGSQIGNGSEMIIRFSTYGWERPEGTGLSLQPKAAQVVQFVAREEQDATDGFEEQEGGYAVAQPTGYVDEFASDEEAPF